MAQNKNDYADSIHGMGLLGTKVNFYHRDMNQVKILLSELEDAKTAIDPWHGDYNDADTIAEHNCGPRDVPIPEDQIVMTVATLKKAMLFFNNLIKLEVQTDEDSYFFTEQR